MIKNKPKVEIKMTDRNISIHGDKNSILSALGAFVLYLVEKENFEVDDIIEVVSLGLAMSDKNRIRKFNNLKDLLDLLK